LIFVTVGQQMGFDRLIRSVDAWAGRSPEVDVLAQIGAGSFRPEHLRLTPTLTPTEFLATLKSADAVVAHAGIGTILQVLEIGRPLLVFPRRAQYRETRNDHQVDTVRRFAQEGLIRGALDEEELHRELDRIGAQPASSLIGPEAPDELVQRVRDVVIECESRT
jgi:UDP-N-acetylglucosamine transferase subunit ALG13